MKLFDKPIAIVLDNARYQHCFVVKTMAKSLGDQLAFSTSLFTQLKLLKGFGNFKKKNCMQSIIKSLPNFTWQLKNSLTQLMSILKGN